MKKEDDKSFCSVVGVQNCISYKSDWTNGHETYVNGKYDYDGLDNLTIGNFNTIFKNKDLH